MAEIRAREAQVLLVGRQYSGAYYLSGYVVECALKACIARQTRRHEFPDLRAVRRSFTHDLEQLVEAAGLKAALEAERGRNPEFRTNWFAVRDWTEGSRYEKIARSEAIGLYNAIVDQRDGVFTWLRLHW